jgi:hypothetical protein
MNRGEAAGRPAIAEELELVDVSSQRVLGVATLLDDGSILVDQATHPYAMVADIRGVDAWSHLKSVGNGYVLMRASINANG